MDFESKHNPRGWLMWERRRFSQPTTFSLEDPLAVGNEQAPVFTEAPLIRIVKHSQKTRRIKMLCWASATMWLFFIRRQNLSRIYGNGCTGVL